MRWSKEFLSLFVVYSIDRLTETSVLFINTRACFIFDEMMFVVVQSVNVDIYLCVYCNTSFVLFVCL